MTVYKKLQEARNKLQNTPLKKSGKNKFANFDYFELQDFLPAVTSICSEVGLCCIPTFDNEVARLDVVCTEKGEKITFETPMRNIEIKGANPIQSLGGVITYQRRYLYINAFEIVENDVSEALTASPTAGENTAAKPKLSKEVIDDLEKYEIKAENLVKYFKLASTDDLTDALAKEAIETKKLALEIK